MRNKPELSFWERDTYLRKADFIIVGSGIVGLNAALKCRELAPNARILVVERGTLPSGASTKNAGFGCFGSVTELLDDLQHHRPEEVWGLVQSRWEGLLRLRQKLSDVRLDYEHHGGFELFMEEDEATFQACLPHLPYLNQHFAHITGEKEVFRVVDKMIPAFNFKGVKHLIWNSLEGQLHPGKMMQTLQMLCLASGIQLLNGIDIQTLQVTPKSAELITTDGITLYAERVLVATNGFARQLLPELDIRPARNQVLITDPILNLPFKGCFHYDRGYYYFRNVGNRILLGGGRNLDFAGETTDQFGTTELIQEGLLKLLHENILPYQTAEVEQWWSGILGLGEQKYPIVKMLSNRVGVAVRMGGMGVAIGTLVGEQAGEMVVKG